MYHFCDDWILIIAAGPSTWPHTKNNSNPATQTKASVHIENSAYQFGYKIKMNVLERARASGKCPPSLFRDEPKEGSFETAVAQVLDANGTSSVSIMNIRDSNS